MTKKAQPGKVSDEQVENYLREHRDFLAEHPNLLAEIDVPHAEAGTVSLIERQVQVLRQQNAQLRGRLSELVEVARENERLMERLHRLSLALLDAGSLDDALATLADSLRAGFQADAVEVRLFADGESAEEVAHPEILLRADDARMAFENVVHSRRPICGRLKHDQLRYLFAERADEIQSAALVPLEDGAVLGLLAIGSRDPQRFHHGMGTVFLGRLGQLAGSVLRRHLR